MIDYYLGWNAHLQPIGRLLIAWVILECEKTYLELGGNINQQERLSASPFKSEQLAGHECDVKKFNDDWCRFVIHNLAINCTTSSDLLKNEVSFVTFNYDVSLEVALHKGLGHIRLFKEEDDVITKFLGAGRIKHIYGEVRDVPPVDLPDVKWERSTGHGIEQYQLDYKEFLDAVYEKSLSIRVIDPKDKKADRDVIDAARKEIDDAEIVYILGYGFDKNNSERLGLSKSLHYDSSSTKKHVLFTNFGNQDRIRKRASGIFLGRPHGFATSVERAGSSR